MVREIVCVVRSLVGPTRSQTDDELAEAAESSLTNSPVSRLFQGLHRSSLTCPHCSRHSNTFDPFLCVSLPLPQKCLRPVYVIVLTLREPGQAVMIGLRLNMYDSIRELREAVSNDTDIPVEQIVLCELTKDGFYATYSNEQPLSDIPESCCIYAVEMECDKEQSSAEAAGFETPKLQILLLHVEKRRQSCRRFCLPEVIQISREVDTKGLQREILLQMGEAVKAEILQQNLRPLFKIQIVDGSSRTLYLPLDVEMPLYTQTVDKVLSMFSEEFGPQHLKLIVEWDSEIKEAVIEDDEEHIVDHESVKNVRSLAQHPVKVSLEECFQLYTQEEKLAGEDAWVCPHCKKAQQGATKTLGLWSLPDVLVLHLKRFKQTGMRRNKLNTLVEFPVEDLDMHTHVIQHAARPTHPDHTLYDLIAVLNHYGNMMGGHYKAFAKNCLDGVWREFDDHVVRAVSQDQVVSSAAYMLFYQRRSLSKLVNQQLHTGHHWVFSLPKPPAHNTSPHRRPSSPVKRGCLQEDLQHLSSTPFDCKVISKEWNGQPSPTRRPPNRPLTPQPQRRQQAAESHPHSPPAVKPRSSFRNSLTRQLSDNAMRPKQQHYQEGEERGRPPTAEPGFSVQPLRVQLPPKSSSLDAEPREEFHQPQKVFLPTHSPPTEPKSTPFHPRPDGTLFKRSDQSPSGDAQLSDAARHLAQQATLHSLSSSSSRDLHPAPFSRPRYQESQYSHDARSSLDSRGSRVSPHETNGFRLSDHDGKLNGSQFYDWQQSEVRSDPSSDKRSSGVTGSPVKPATAVTSRVMSKPPIPPKILTRPVDSDSGSSSSPVHKQDTFHVTVATPSLTSPPSPAPKDSARPLQQRPIHPPDADTQRGRDPSRHSGQDGEHVSCVWPSPRPSHGERFIALNDAAPWLSVDSHTAGNTHLLEREEFERRKKKIESQIPAEVNLPRRRSQHLPDKKFATIARSNPHHKPPPRAVPRSSTDHSIHGNHYGHPQLVPSHRFSSENSPHASERGSLSSEGSPGYPRSYQDYSRSGEGAGYHPRLERDWRSAEKEALTSHLPIYAREEPDSHHTFSREGRTHIYRGPMFQRPKRGNSDIATPTLRESSV